MTTWPSRAVDRYLKSAHFGERWGRHWLDLARYADNTGRAWNAPFTYAWRYRDWVIGAFNHDLPYDRFLTEQLAGDLLPATTAAQQREQMIATGFLAIGAHDLQKGGIRYGATDELGEVAVEGRMGTHGLHATILHLLGLDHEGLTFRYAGRDFRLTDTSDEVAKGVIA